PAHRTPPGALVCDRAAVVPEARVALLARAFSVAVGREANNRVPGACGGGLAGLRVEGATKANVRARQLQADCRPLTPTPCPPPPEPQAGGADALGDADGPITDSLLGGGGPQVGHIEQHLSCRLCRPGGPRGMAPATRSGLPPRTPVCQGAGRFLVHSGRGPTAP